MKLIKPSYSILEQKPGLKGIYEAIENAGRLCYKSERPEGKTAKDFVDMLIKNKHYAMLEHGTVYLKIPSDLDNKFYKYYDNPYSKAVDGVDVKSNITLEDRKYYYITTNYRVLVENNWLDDLKYICEPTEFHEKRATVKFITSIGIVRELIRHRKFSFANESTRYCNYSKNKFNNEVSFIIPSWCKTSVAIQATGPRAGFAISINNKSFTELERAFYELLKASEDNYMYLLNTGCKPQEAREVLPLATKSELIMTGFVSDWKHVFKLRSSIAATGQPHPDCKALINPLMQEFINRNYIRNEKF